MIAAYYGMSDVFDNLVISLCKFTTLLSAQEVCLLYKKDYISIHEMILIYYLPWVILPFPISPRFTSLLLKVLWSTPLL